MWRGRRLVHASLANVSGALGQVRPGTGRRPREALPPQWNFHMSIAFQADRHHRLKAVVSSERASRRVNRVMPAVTL